MNRAGRVGRGWWYFLLILLFRHQRLAAVSASRASCIQSINGCLRKCTVRLSTQRCYTRRMVPGGSTEHSFLICPRCKASISWPAQITSEAREQIAAEVRSMGLRAIHGIGASAGLGLAEAKALLFHITRIRGQCHRCGRDLTAGATICQHCQSANLDW